MTPTKYSVNVSSRYPQFTDKKTKHPDLLKVPGLVSVRAEASPGRQSNSRQEALNTTVSFHHSRKGTTMNQFVV